MSLQFSECHTKIRHVDAHATLSDGVVVQVLGELSNNGQPMRKFMQTFVLAPEVSTLGCCYWILTFQWCPEVTFELFTIYRIVGPFPQGSVANKFYVHNDIFRYEDEVFGDSEAELDEGKVQNTFRCIAMILEWTPPPPPSGTDICSLDVIGQMSRSNYTGQSWLI